MDPTTASYYRAILFQDSQDTQLIPKSLLLLHMWVVKRSQALGLNSTITKATALTVALTWLSTTKEGRAFSQSLPIASLFAEENESTEAEPVEWENVAPETKVIAMVDDRPVVGEFLGRKSSWLEVRIAGEKKSFRFQQVQLAGV